MKRIYPLIPALLFPFFLLATPAPDFTVTTSDGVTRKLYQDYVNQQKLVVLEIFFTTCPPCAAHAPYWQALYQNMKTAYPGRLEFMLLSDKNADTNPLVNTYLANKGLTMPAAGSAGGSLAAVQPYKNNNFGLFYGTPTFIVIAPGTGEVFFDIRGNSAQETMSLLSQKIGDLLNTDCFLKSYFDNPVDSVQLTVDAPAFDTTFVASGTYSLSGIPALENTTYTVTPFKNSDPLSGLSTFDLVLMSKHILGLTPFTEPWQLLAADLNCSGTITTFDIVEGRKLILGINNGFSGCGGGTWRFVADPDGTTGNGSCLNFRGVRIGDLNGPYFSPGADDREPARLAIEDRRLERGQTYHVAVRTRTAFRLTGLQLDFGLDPAALSIHRVESPVLAGFDARHYNLELQRNEGHVPVSWISADRPAGIVAGDALLVLEVEARQEGRLSDLLRLRTQLRAEAYEEAGEPRALELEWSRETAPDFRLAPNPARDAVVIGFRADVAGDTPVQLVDGQGKVVAASTYAVTAGENRIELRPGRPLSGLHFVRVGGKAAGTVFFENRD